MGIEARVSKFRKQNLMILIALCAAAAVWFAYDGYYNKSFIDGHRDAEGRPDSTLAFNRKSPPYFAAAAVLLTAYLLMIRGRMIEADEEKLLINGKETIAYDSIEKIDKTDFGSKGYFVVTYRDRRGREVNRRLSSRKYDNLEAVLEHLVEKIS